MHINKQRALSGIQNQFFSLIKVFPKVIWQYNPLFIEQLLSDSGNKQI